MSKKSKPGKSAAPPKELTVEAQIHKAIKTSNVWEIRKVFKNVGLEFKQRYLNEYWIPSGIHAGYTFLHLSILSDIDICKYLLEEGSAPNQYNKRDNTPLHLAASHGRGILIRLLIKHGADPLLKNEAGKMCHEMCDSAKKSKEMKALIEKCIAEQDILNQIKQLPFQTIAVLKQIVSEISEESIMDDVLEIIAVKMSDADFEDHCSDDTAQTRSESHSATPNEALPAPIQSDHDADTPSEHVSFAVNRMEMVNKWSAVFSSAGISVFSQLLLPAFEEWPITVRLPAFVVYSLETILSAWSQRLMDEIKSFSATTKIGEVLATANHKLKNKFGDSRLKEFESMLMEQGVYTLHSLTNVTSRTWRILKIDLVFSDQLRKIINLFHMNADGKIDAQRKQQSEASRKKQDPCTLLTLANTVSCVCVDDKFIHIATMDGSLRAFEFSIFDAFHEFILRDDDGVVHIALFMQFLDAKTHRELVTADESGAVCCWLLHSQHPNQRAKCIRHWPTHRGHISGFAYDAKAELIYTVGVDGYLRVRSLGYDGQIVHSMQFGAGNVALTALTMRGRGNKNSVLIGTENGVVLEVDSRKQKIANVFRMADEHSAGSPIRCLCIDDGADTESDSAAEHSYVFFSFGAASIGVLDIGADGEWRCVGKLTEGLECHSGAVNDLRLRGQQLWSASEDGSVRIWDLKFLREGLADSQKKKKTDSSMRLNTIRLADSQRLSSNGDRQNSNQKNGNGNEKQNEMALLEVWCSLDLSGQWPNGVQRIHFNENAKMLIGCAYQKQLIAYDLVRIDNLLPQKQELIAERRKQLNGYEKELATLLSTDGGAAAEGDKAKGKKGGKGKKGKKGK